MLEGGILETRPLSRPSIHLVTGKSRLPDVPGHMSGEGIEFD